MKVARCSSCDANVVWMVTNRGKRMPVDEADVETVANVPLFDPEAGHISHFATCPHANQHRRR